MEPKVLSSRLTFATKFVFPVLGIVLFGSVVVLLWAADVLVQASWFMGIWIVGLTFVLWTSATLKKLSTDQQSLLVSNYLEEIVVPFHMIAKVTESQWIKLHPVTIHFRSDTAFGRKIRFMPKRQWFMLWTSHPVVGELQRLAGLADADS